MLAEGELVVGVELLVAAGGRAVHLSVSLAEAARHVLRKLDEGDHHVAVEAYKIRSPTGVTGRLPFLLIEAVILVGVGVELESAFWAGDIRRWGRQLTLFGRFRLVEIQDVADKVLWLDALEVAERTPVPPEGVGGPLVSYVFLPVHEQRYLGFRRRFLRLGARRTCI